MLNAELVCCMFACLFLLSTIFTQRNVKKLFMGFLFNIFSTYTPDFVFHGATVTSGILQTFDMLAFNIEMILDLVY